MEIIHTFLETLHSFVPAAIAIVAGLFVILVTRWILNRRYAGRPGRQFRLQLVILLLSFLGLLVVILALPISESATGQLLSLIGILLSAAIALSATTFVGNIMGGLMLRAVNNFRPGDFLRVGEYFGRVSEQGLFHTEIQTEDRDLTTMPNLFLVTNPVKVVRSSGTLVTAEVSLGYDIPHARVEQALIRAAEDAGLEEPFVHVLGLNDFSVSYRIAGLLTDVKSLLSTRSRLRSLMLDRLHEADIEIVSPTFMNQRAITPERCFIPEAAPGPSVQTEPEVPPEAVVFDKADEAESLEKLRDRHKKMLEDITGLKESREKATDPDEKDRLAAEIELLGERAERLATYIDERKKQKK